MKSTTSKNNNRSQDKISAPRRFISIEEWTEIKKLFDEHRRLNDQAMSLSYDGLRYRFEQALETYRNQPTDGNLLLAIDVSHLQHLLTDNQRIRAAVKDVAKSYAQNRLFPLLKQVLNRGLELAREAAEKIIAAENARVLALVGEPADESTSQVVRHARRPVLELEQLVRSLDGPTAAAGGNVDSISRALRRYVKEEASTL